MTRSAEKVFPTADHNHGLCQTRALDQARERFETKGLRWTELRQRVFEEIASSHRAVGAYDVLDLLARKGPRLAPISVYRAIDALLEAGVVHRLESKNAYFACHSAHATGGDQLVVICEQCARVAEIAGDRIFAAISASAGAVGFEIRRTMVEVTGRCADCIASGPSGQ